MLHEAVKPTVREYTCLTPRIAWGIGSASSIREQLARVGGKRALLISGRTVGSSSWFQKLKTELGECCAAVYSDIEPHTPIESLAGAIHIARAEAVDCIVMVGGGAAIDAGKLVAVALAEGDDLDRFKIHWTEDRQLQIPVLSQPKIPLIAIPTTLAAAEVVGAATYVSDNQRFVVVDSGILPRVVIYDPEVAVTTPPHLFLGTGINAIAHCVEAICSIRAQPFSDALAEGSLRALVEGLARSAKNPTDLCAYEQAMVGAAMSGVAYTGTWLGIAHALCQALGARFRVAQGLLHAVILPHAIRFNLPATADRQEQIFRAVAAGMGLANHARKTTDASLLMAQFIESIGLPSRLRELGIPKAELQVVAEDAFTVWHTHFNPRHVASPEELWEVMLAAW